MLVRPFANGDAKMVDVLATISATENDHHRDGKRP
jgi:hypothetical protein